MGFIMGVLASRDVDVACIVRRTAYLLGLGWTLHFTQNDGGGVSC